MSVAFQLKGDNPPVYGIEPEDASWDDKNYTYMYVRAVLGLAEQFEFVTTDRNVKIIAKVEVLSLNTTERNDDVQRFASPLLFKVFEDNIYLVVNEKECPLEQLRVRFKLSLKNAPNHLRDRVKNTEPLSIPHIDYYDFLDQALNFKPYNGNDIDLEYEFEN
jgi:hypothetical protein